MIYGKREIRDHLDNYNDRANKLVSVMRKFAEKDDVILEPGCSAGRNLIALHKEGFKHLVGIDAHKEAIDALRKECPAVSAVYGDLDKMELPEADIIFTMSLLYLLDDESIFQKIAHKAKKYVMTFEGERGQHDAQHYLHDRNYQDIFTGLGMTQVFEDTGFGPGSAIRVFKHENN